MAGVSKLNLSKYSWLAGWLRSLRLSYGAVNELNAALFGGKRAKAWRSFDKNVGSAKLRSQYKFCLLAHICLQR